MKNKYFVLSIVLFVFSVIALFIGGIIYLLYRPHTLYMFSWLREIGLESFFKQRTFDTNSIIKSFCVFNLPNGLWALSAIIQIGIIFSNSKQCFYFYSILFTLGNVLFEFFQLFKVIPGTFDYMDILVLIIPFLCGILIYKFIFKENSYEN